MQNKENDIEISSLASREERNNRSQFFQTFLNNAIPEDEQLANIGLFLKRQELMKILFFNDLYPKIMKTHGVIMELGTRWGQNLVTLSNLRAIYEPYNYNRKIIGFDTFQGFLNISEEDGTNEIIKKGAFSVTKEYEKQLNDILNYHEKESPLSHIKKHEIIKGDAVKTLKKYLKDNPQTIIAFAYFDFDLYEPTVECLKLIKKHLVKGSILGFDELNDPKFPGETVALEEVLGLNNISIERNQYGCMQSFLIYK